MEFFYQKRLNLFDAADRKQFFGGVFKDRIKLMLLIFVVYFIFNLFNAGCPSLFLFGLSCPGCGMTRAVLATLRLDFAAAFYYHPLFFLSPVIVFLFLFQELFEPKLYKVIWGIIITLFILTYLYRLFILKSEITTIDIWSGLVLKLIQQII